MLCIFRDKYPHIFCAVRFKYGAVCQLQRTCRLSGLVKLHACRIICGIECFAIVGHVSHIRIGLSGIKAPHSICLRIILICCLYSFDSHRSDSLDRHGSVLTYRSKLCAFCHFPGYFSLTGTAGCLEGKDISVGNGSRRHSRNGKHSLGRFSDLKGGCAIYNEIAALSVCHDHLCFSGIYIIFISHCIFGIGDQKSSCIHSYRRLFFRSVVEISAFRDGKPDVRLFHCLLGYSQAVDLRCVGLACFCVRHCHGCVSRPQERTMLIADLHFIVCQDFSVAIYIDSRNGNTCKIHSVSVYVFGLLQFTAHFYAIHSHSLDCQFYRSCHTVIIVCIHRHKCPCI